MSAARRGFTIAEVLIGSSLAAVIATVMLMFLYTSLQAQARMAVRADVQEQGIMAATRMVKDLQSALINGVSLRKATATEPEVLAIHPLVGVGTNDPPRQIFSSQLIVYAYQPGQGKLARFLYPEDPTTPTNPGIVPRPFKSLLVDQPNLLWLAQHPSSNVTRFGGDITALNVTLNSSITISITLTKAVKDKPYTYVTERTISLRNSD